MDKKFYLNSLYDYYGELFTEKQQEYFKAYYFEDLSLSEIAENNDVSRNAVHGQLKIVEEKLVEYENVLHLHEKGKRIKELLKNVDENISVEIKKLI